MICGGVLLPDGTRHCFVEEQGLGARDQFHARGKGDPLAYSLDHFVPVSMGGDDHPDNLHFVHYHDQRIQGGHFGAASLTPEIRRRAGGSWWASATPVQRERRVQNINAAMTPEKRSAAGKKVQAQLTPEERRRRALKGWSRRKDLEKV